MKETTKKIRSCPKCHQEYTAAPAISRTDNKTEICPNCGMMEALDALGASTKRAKESALEAAKKVERQRTRLTILVALVIYIAAIGAALAAKNGYWTFLGVNVATVLIELALFRHLLK